MNTQEGHDSRAIANLFVDKARKAKKQLTIMELVKYVYLAHGWTLGLTDAPLIKDKVEAWQYGPVVPVVYRAFRPQGVVIDKKAIDEETGKPYSADSITQEQLGIIEEVYRVYSQVLAFELSSLTHGQGTPWSKCYGKPEIDDETIKRHYKEIAKSAV